MSVGEHVTLDEVPAEAQSAILWEPIPLVQLDDAQRRFLRALDLNELAQRHREALGQG